MPSGCHSRKSGLQLAAVLLLGGWLVVLLRLSSHPSLLDKATKTPFTEDMQYQWLPNQQLLVCEEQSAAPSRLARYDILTGQKTPLTALSQQFPLPSETFADSSISPDGKWLLYWKDERRNSGQICATTLDGAQHLYWNMTNNYAQPERSSFFWLTDGRRFARLPYHNTFFDKEEHSPPLATVRDITAPQETRKQPFAFTPEFDARDYYTCPRMTNSGLLYSYTSADEENPTRTLLTVSLAPHAAKTKTVVQAPPGMTFVDRPSVVGETVIVSPSGDQVAWLLHSSTYTPPLHAWLHRIIPKLEAKSYQWMSLYVSSLDGSDMREIGGVEMEMTISRTISLYTQEIFHDGQEIEDLRWLPDGKHLSFLHHHALYTVPAE